jgi:hypothetical protein
MPEVVQQGESSVEVGDDWRASDVHLDPARPSASLEFACSCRLFYALITIVSVLAASNNKPGNFMMTPARTLREGGQHEEATHIRAFFLGMALRNAQPSPLASPAHAAPGEILKVTALLYSHDHERHIVPLFLAICET